MLAELIVNAKMAEKKYNRFFSAAKTNAVSAVLSIVGIAAVVGGILAPLYIR